LATSSAQAERHIGTQGGGMDQAIAFLGKAGNSALSLIYMNKILLFIHLFLLISLDYSLLFLYKIKS